MPTLTSQEQEIHQQFSEYGRNAKEWIRKCQLLLPLVAKCEIWKKKKFSSIYEYAAKLAGMGKSSVDTALWVIRRVEDKPALLKVVENYGVHRVKAVVSLATAETQEFWAEKSRQMSQHALETYVRESKKVLRAEKTQPGNLDVMVTLKSDLARRFKELRKHAAFERNFEEKFERLLNELEEEFSEEKPPAVRTHSRHIPAKIEKFVQARTNGLCAFPDCVKAATILHHTQRWAIEKVHDPNRLVPLCKSHERLAHHGLIHNEEGPPYTWTLREQADKNAHKFYIDQFVQRYRRPHSSV